MEEAMDMDDENSVVCVSGKNKEVDRGYCLVDDLVGLEGEGGAEIQPWQKSITWRETSYQINKHFDSSDDDDDDDDDCDDDDNSSRCSELTDDSNKHTSSYG